MKTKIQEAIALLNTAMKYPGITRSEIKSKMENGEAIYLAVWLPGEYDPACAIVGIEFFTVDNGYDYQDITDINNLDLYETHYLTDHRIERIC